MLCDRPSVLDSVDGQVALLGDAVYPMLQYLFQGACMAMEDAICLGEMVSAHPGRIEAGLRANAA